jgi:hypothetical protein
MEEPSSTGKLVYDTAMQLRVVIILVKPRGIIMCNYVAQPSESFLQYETQYE